MQTMTTILHTDPFDSDDSGDGFEIPIAPAGHLQRAIDLLAGGNLSDDEQSFVDRAVNHNWTIRIIVEHLREQRGMVEVPVAFDWRVI